MSLNRTVSKETLFVPNSYNENTLPSWWFRPRVSTLADSPMTNDG